MKLSPENRCLLETEFGFDPTILCSSRSHNVCVVHTQSEVRNFLVQVVFKVACACLPLLFPTNTTRNPSAVRCKLSDFIGRFWGVALGGLELINFIAYPAGRRPASTDPACRPSSTNAGKVFAKHSNEGCKPTNYELRSLALVCSG